ncbi:MAG TPA: YicC/YloC family endoribonuclease [Alphaproteobacteria bacterium]|nr:YicC/YloC family endoribonuclease [Alphaproteobacteria bacterium]
MTGFARAVGHDEATSWTWEVKSVNGRSLDMRFRFPVGYDRLEAQARGLAIGRLKRGSLTVSLILSRVSGAAGWRINRDLIDELLSLHEDFTTRIAPAPPRLDTILTVRGVVEQIEDDSDEAAAERRAEAVLASLVEALDNLIAARESEGARLATVLAAHLDEIARLTTAAESLAVLRPDAIKARIKEQVAALLGAESILPEERLAQELALIAAKADVREELDRLKAHIAAARELLVSHEAIGRRLDFLCQEFNREANTLCSKASDVALTRLGLDLKATIEQFREQVQNVE